MYDFVYLSVRRSVRDSHWSRDYRDGTGFRIFCENPGFYTETEDRTAEKAAKMVVAAGTVALWLDLFENPWIVVARSLGETGSALWKQCSSWFSVAGFWLCSS
jgi:hypothetical protein